MCSSTTESALKTMMENYQAAGDLGDIFRPSATTVDGGGDPLPDWQFPGNPIAYSSDPLEDFGDPFTYLRDPLIIPTASPLFYNNSNVESSGGGFGIGRSINSNGGDQEMIKRPSSNNMFSRMLQISPNSKSPSSSHSQARPHHMLLSNNNNNNNNNNNRMLISAANSTSSKGCLVESSVALQISSPRNTAIKRRKSQAKKVVCIPAPAPANSRATGEVVPSDLWAWRKYGQKPIKGSPYPRGYYRCSSSKGCSARKQVERSRTDPNMLVITYTWDHNHPWPTQRNALAGSTRSQPSKNTTTKKDHQTTKSKLESSSSKVHVVKEEMVDHQDYMNNNQFDDQGTYKPDLEESSFFADLSEIEITDPLDLQGFCNDDDQQGQPNKDYSDSFSFYI